MDMSQSSYDEVSTQHKSCLNQRPKCSSLAQSIALRAIAISMGFVFFAGGWRRFYNTPAKHNIHLPEHLANKLVEAAPGSPIESIIHWVLYHPSVAEWATYAMSTAEMIVGSALMLGLMTRLAATGSALINLALMLIFGWMGYECLDEWTMAALGFAISVAIMFSGSSAFSIDSLTKKDWFVGCFKAPFAKVLLVASVGITVGFYSYFFGIFHFKKHTSTAQFHIVAQPVMGQADRITLYVNGGGSSNAAYVRSISYKLKDGSTIVEQPNEIKVLREHFAPWSQSGKVVDGVLKLRLGAKVDIAIPANSVGATIDLIDAKKDPELTW